MAEFHSRRKPLEGIRILDLSRVLAGAGATRMLGILGAEVLRVEWDTPPALDPLRMTKPHLDGVPGLERSGVFAQTNVDKKSMGINLRTDEGRSILEALVPHCDVVFESFSANVLRKWGLHYEALRELREDIIYVAASGWGHFGPYSSYRSYGPTAQAFGGLTAMSGLPDREPAGWGFSYMDHMGAVLAAAAILMGIEHRKLTGHGCFLDVPQCVDAPTLLGPAILDAAVKGQRIGRRGNRDLFRNRCPNNVYPCMGEDRWIAISISRDEEWDRLLNLMGNPEWAADTNLRGLARRLANEDLIDDRIAAWTRGQDEYELQRLLQDNGIPAGVAQTIADKLERDEQLRHRGFYEHVDDPLLGMRPYEGTAIGIRGYNTRIANRSPRLGEHTGEVLSGLLGYSQSAIDQLIQSKVLLEPGLQPS